MILVGPLGVKANFEDPNPNPNPIDTFVGGKRDYMHVIAMVERHWMIICVHESEEVVITLCPALLHDVSICHLGGIWTEQGARIAIRRDFTRKTTPNTRQV